MHIHYALFAEILRDLAKTMASLPRPMRRTARRCEALRDEAKALYLALDADAGGSKDDISKMTPDEEVLLLHVIE